MSDTNNPRKVAVAYLEAIGRKDFDAFERLLAPDVTFKGPAATLSGAPNVSAAYQRLAAILVRNDLEKAFVDGNEVCIIYNYVTDTPAGAVPTMEWLKIEDGKIRSIWLLTDHVRWPIALEELGRRAASKKS
jgi:ketosteroid isomerase-like protein